MEEKKYEYLCQECEEKFNCIYAYYPTNQWLCKICLRAIDRKYARVIQYAEQQHAGDKAREVRKAKRKVIHTAY